MVERQKWTRNKKQYKKQYKPNKINDFHNAIKEAKKNKIGSCGLNAKLENGVRVGHRATQSRGCSTKTNNNDNNNEKKDGV